MCPHLWANRISGFSIGGPSASRSRHRMSRKLVLVAKSILGRSLDFPCANSRRFAVADTREPVCAELRRAGPDVPRGESPGVSIRVGRGAAATATLSPPACVLEFGHSPPIPVPRSKRTGTSRQESRRHRLRRRRETQTATCRLYDVSPLAGASSDHGCPFTRSGVRTRRGRANLRASDRSLDCHCHNRYRRAPLIGGSTPAWPITDALPRELKGEIRWGAAAKGRIPSHERLCSNGAGQANQRRTGFANTGPPWTRYFELMAGL